MKPEFVPTHNPLQQPSQTPPAPQPPQPKQATVDDRPKTQFEIMMGKFEQAAIDKK
jgi:hypothetical protein